MTDKEKNEQKVKELSTMVSEFCKEFIDEEYAQLCVKMVVKLGRKRSKPLISGRINNWAAAIIYSVGSINFLFDKSFQPFIKRDVINDHFGTKNSTVSSKSRDIMEMLKISRFWDPEFSTRHMIDSNPFNSLFLLR